MHEAQLDSVTSTPSRQNPNVEKILYDRKSAAYALSLSIRSVDYYIANKKLPFIKKGRKVMIPADALKKFAKSNHYGPSLPSSNAGHGLFLGLVLICESEEETCHVRLLQRSGAYLSVRKGLVLSGSNILMAASVIVKRSVDVAMPSLCTGLARLKSRPGKSCRRTCGGAESNSKCWPTRS